MYARVCTRVPQGHWHKRGAVERNQRAGECECRARHKHGKVSLRLVAGPKLKAGSHALIPADVVERWWHPARAIVVGAPRPPAPFDGCRSSHLGINVPCVKVERLAVGRGAVVIEHREAPHQPKPTDRVRVIVRVPQAFVDKAVLRRAKGGENSSLCNVIICGPAVPISTVDKDRIEDARRWRDGPG